MNNSLSNVVKKTKRVISKYSPEILVTLGVSSMITSTVLAVKATPKALILIEDAEKEKTGMALTKKKLDWKETVQVTWKEYLPAASFGVSGIIFVILGCKVNSKRSAALATAYAISEKTLRTYRDKVIETIGEKKEKQIREQVNQDQIDKNPVQNNQVIITSKGNTLMMDSISGRYFRSDLETIRKILNDLNREITYQNYISLNEFYYALGLDGIKPGDNMGWNIDGGLIELEFNTCLADNDEPCICIDYIRMPHPNFNK